MQLDLVPTTEQSVSLPRGRTLQSLPYDIRALIFEHLYPVDLVCLALTCKSLLATIYAHPRLPPAKWIRYTPTPSVGAPLTYFHITPEWYPLFPRLAHGWLDKKTWRYCWKCHRILPREPGWFKEKGRMKMAKSPRWSVKVGMSKEEWLSLGKKTRYRHLIETWCTSGQEDSSAMYCDGCRGGRYEAGEGQPVQQKQQMAPVECPICLERDLTFSWFPSTRGRSRAKKAAEEVLRWSCIYLRMAIVFGLETATMSCVGLGHTIGKIGKVWKCWG